MSSRNSKDSNKKDHSSGSVSKGQKFALQSSESLHLKTMNRKSKSSSVVALRREIGLLSAIGLIVSVMIGSGIFISPSRVLEKTGSVGLCLVVWATCGVISYFGALSFAELGVLVPSSGAEYIFYFAAFKERHKFFGALPSFLYIWVMVFLVRPAEVAILILSFSEYVYNPTAYYLNLDFSPEMEYILKKLISLLAISLITFVNFTSVKMYVRIQNMFSFLKLVACVVIVGGGIYHLSCGHTEYINKGFEGSKTSIKDLVLAFYTGLWSFDGWTSVTVVSEEIKSPSRNIPMSISIGVPLITALYFAMNVSYMSVLSVEEMIAAPAVAMASINTELNNKTLILKAFAEKLFGYCSFVIPLAVILATFSCAMSVQFGVTRLCFAAAKYGHVVKCFSYIHIKRMTPAPAVALQGTLATVFIIIGQIKELIEFVSFMIWIFYGLAFVALLVLKHSRKDVPRPYKVPVVIPFFLILMSGFFAVVPLVLDPDLQYLGAMVYILVGVTFYYFIIYKEKDIMISRWFSYYVQALMQVIPSEQ